MRQTALVGQGHQLHAIGALAEIDVDEVRVTVRKGGQGLMRAVCRRHLEVAAVEKPARATRRALWSWTRRTVRRDVVTSATGGVSGVGVFGTEGWAVSSCDSWGEGICPSREPQAATCWTTSFGDDRPCQIRTGRSGGVVVHSRFFRSGHAAASSSSWHVFAPTGCHSARGRR